MAAEKLMERESIRLFITSQSGDAFSTVTLYYDIKDGEPRWYRIINDQIGKRESFVMNGTEYGRYDPEGLINGIKTSWETNTKPGLFDQIPEYREKKQRDLLHPQELNSFYTWSDEKEQFETVHQLEDSRYEFRYSAFALDQIRQKRIEEVKQQYQWLMEIAARKEGLENSELYLQSSVAAVRQAEEAWETSKIERICLDESGNIKTAEYAMTAEIRLVIPNLETGEITVSEETDLLKASSVLEIKAADDPSITGFLDKMAASVELQKIK